MAAVDRLDADRDGLRPLQERLDPVFAEMLADGGRIDPFSRCTVHRRFELVTLQVATFGRKDGLQFDLAGFKPLQLGADVGEFVDGVTVGMVMTDLPSFCFQLLIWGPPYRDPQLKVLLKVVLKVLLKAN